MEHVNAVSLWLDWDTPPMGPTVFRSFSLSIPPIYTGWYYLTLYADTLVNANFLLASLIAGFGIRPGFFPYGI